VRVDAPRDLVEFAMQHARCVANRHLPVQACSI
jgi:hypothetical protein